jgi:hypothetical protein
VSARRAPRRAAPQPRKGRARTHISAHLALVSVMEMAVMTASSASADVRTAAEPFRMAYAVCRMAKSSKKTRNHS